jgi:hypothetical protein
MKGIAPALLLAACVDSEPSEVTQSTQAMMRQPGETIEVHSCPSGEVEREGGGTCYNPAENLPPPDYGWHSTAGGGGTQHSGVGGGPAVRGRSPRRIQTCSSTTRQSAEPYVAVRA